MFVNTIKPLIKSFIDCINLSLFFFKSIINQNIFLKKIDCKNNKDKALILGNGPSLKSDIKKILENCDSYDTSAVNYFALNDYFFRIKPKYYFFMDKMFWSDKVNQKIKSNNKILFKKILEINWDIKIFCSFDGYIKLKRIFEPNTFIKVMGVKTNTFQFKNENINTFSMNKNITTPDFGRNVLIMALWYAIVSNYKIIEIYGADFSQFREFIIDQKTNETINDQKHFYKVLDGHRSTDKKYVYKKERKIHERLYQLSIMFKQMYLLSLLAKSKNIKVVNCSSNSFIDCFDRPS